MKVFDQGFVYHSNVGRAVVGIVEVCRESARESTTDDPRWDCVIIRALRPVARQSGWEQRGNQDEDPWPRRLESG